MNKQEAIEKLQSEARHHCGEKECYKDGCTKNVELDIAIDIVNQIDKPEKVVVSKLEAEWLDKLKARYRHREDQLYVITRQGWGNDFYFTYCGTRIELSYEPYKEKEDIESVKRRLVNVLIYGYEVEKEKLYTARFKLLDDDVEECYINQTIDDKKFFLGNLDENNYVKVFFTQEELKKLGLWENALIDTDEVKDD